MATRQESLNVWPGKVPRPSIMFLELLDLLASPQAEASHLPAPRTEAHHTHKTALSYFAHPNEVGMERGSDKKGNT